MVEGGGGGCAEDGIATDGGAVVTVLMMGLLLFIVASDLHTVVDDTDDDSVEFRFAVVAFGGTVFSALHNTGFNCDGWLVVAANGALLLFFTTNFCISLRVYLFTFSHYANYARMPLYTQPHS